MRLTLDLTAKPTYSEEYLKLHQKFNVPLHGLTPEQTRFFHYAFRNEVNVFWLVIPFFSSPFLRKVH